MKSIFIQSNSLSFLEKGILISLNELYLSNPELFVSEGEICKKIGAKLISEQKIVDDLLKSYFTWQDERFVSKQLDEKKDKAVQVFKNRSLRAKNIQRPQASGHVYVYLIDKNQKTVFGCTTVFQEAFTLPLKKRHGKGKIIAWFAVNNMQAALNYLEENFKIADFILPDTFYRVENLTVSPAVNQPKSSQLESIAPVAPVATSIKRGRKPKKLPIEQLSILDDLIPHEEILREADNLKEVGKIEQEDSQIPNLSVASTNVVNAEQIKNKSEFSEGFDLFWQAYANTGCSRMAGRSDCFKRWQKTGAEAHIELILRQIQYFVDSKVFDPKKPEYIGAPATYINQKKWDGWVMPKLTTSKFKKTNIKSVSNFEGKEDEIF